MLTLMLVLVAAGPAGAAADTKGAPPADPEQREQIARSNGACLACHSPEALAAPPRADLDLAALRRTVIDPARYQHSNHAGMACTACHHQGTEPFPHDPATAATPRDCGGCHERSVQRIGQQVRHSVHARSLSDRFTCHTCHDPHVYRVATGLGDPKQIVRQDNAMCLDCHESDARFSELGLTLHPARRRPDLKAAHAWLPEPRLHAQAVRCVDCHTPESPIRRLGLSHQILPKERAVRQCEACHTERSDLRSRLYRHLAGQEHQELGFTNSVMLSNAYIVGATRNRWLDLLALGLTGLAVAGIFVHAGVRIVAVLIRRRRSAPPDGTSPDKL